LPWTRFPDDPWSVIPGRAPSTKTLPTIRLPSLPTSTKRPDSARTTRLKVKALRLDPTPSWNHSTLIPVFASTIRFLVISESFVECSR